MTTTDPARSAKPRVDWLLRILGLVALLVVAVFPFAATGLFAPLWAVVVAWAVWFGAGLLTWRTSRRRPRLTPLVPLAAAAVWYVAVTAAAAAFSWTA